MIRAVIDTNVIASGFVGVHSQSSTPGEIIRRWLDGKFEMVVSSHILEEVDRTLQKAYFQRRLVPGHVSSTIGTFATIVDAPIRVTGVTSQPGDDLVLSVAVSSDARYLVTGDAAFRSIGEYRTVTILGPREFVGVLDSQPIPEG